MKNILLLSDLHKVISDKYNEERQNNWIRSLLSNIDCVVITGDIFETQKTQPKIFNPYISLQSIFGKKLPIVCCLGNHEFFYNTIDETLEFYEKIKPIYCDNIHYLDIEGHFDLDGVRFVGNVLWYDGSLSTVNNQNIYEWKTWQGGGGWQDCTIKNFDYAKENKKCIEQIDSNLDFTKINVLCTHCVPHHEINSWMKEDCVFGNYMNAYSGNYDILKDWPSIKYSISGHTHKYNVSEIYGIECYNIGNDLHPPFRSKIITIDSK